MARQVTVEEMIAKRYAGRSNARVAGGNDPVYTQPTKMRSGITVRTRAVRVGAPFVWESVENPTSLSKKPKRKSWWAKKKKKGPIQKHKPGGKPPIQTPHKSGGNQKADAIRRRAHGPVPSHLLKR